MEQSRPSDADETSNTPPLLPFGGDLRQGAPEHLPFGFLDYLELVDWTGRAVRQEKSGAIDSGVPPILGRFGIDPDQYVRYMQRPEYAFARAIGRVETLRETAAALGQRFLKGIGIASRLFPTLSG